MAYRKNSSSGEESFGAPGQDATTYDVQRATITLYGDPQDFEITADGVDNMLELLQGSDALTDLTGMTIPTEPTPGTAEHDEWAAQWEGLEAVPSNGSKVVARVRIELVCYEEQV